MKKIENKTEIIISISLIIFLIPILVMLKNISKMDNEIKTIKSTFFLYGQEKQEKDDKKINIKNDSFNEEKRAYKEYNAKFNISFTNEINAAKNIKKIIRNISNKYKLKILLIKKDESLSRGNVSKGLWLIKIIDSKINKKNIKKILFKFSFPKNTNIYYN